MSGRPSRKQLQQQLASQKAKFVRRHRKRHDSELFPLSQEMIQESIVRASVDRLQSLLPSRKGECQRPSTPLNNPKPRVNDIPFVSTKCRRIPWLIDNVNRSSSSTTSDSTPTPPTLSDELRMFSAYVSLDQAEYDCRKMVIKNIEDAVKAKWPEAIVQSFGSFPSNLSTFLSDVDITILGLSQDSEVPKIHEGNSGQQGNHIVFNDSPHRLPDVVNTFVPVSTHPLDHSSSSSSTTVHHPPETNSPKRQKLDTAEPTEEVLANDEEDDEVKWFLDRGSNLIVLNDEEDSVKGDEQSVEVKESFDIHPSQSIVDLTSSPPPVPSPVNEISDDADDDDPDHVLSSSQHLYSHNDSSADYSSDDLRSQSDSVSNYSSDTDDDADDDTSDCISELDENELILTNNHGGLDIHVDSFPSTNININTTTNNSQRSLVQSRSSSPTPASRKQELEILHILTHYLRSLDYTRTLEFRSKARVPIINLIHKGGIECDISIGLSNSKTNNLIQLLSYQSQRQSSSPSSLSSPSTQPQLPPPPPPPPQSQSQSQSQRQLFPSPSIGSSRNSQNNNRIFYEISCFLKVFFHQLHLDTPYTGGLGSYKLYGMITFVINLIQEEQRKNKLKEKNSTSHNLNTTTNKTPITAVKDVEEKEDLTLDSGYILIYFFKYYGSKNNLNLRTVLRIRNQNTLPSNSGRHEGRGARGGGRGDRGGRGKRSHEELQDQSDQRGRERDEEEEDIVIEFSKATQIVLCQQMCARAYCILYLIITKGIEHVSTISSASSPASFSSSSISTLSVLISRCDQFIQNRMLSSKLCRIECPFLLDCDKDNMANIILCEMKTVLNSAIDQQITSQDIKKFNPLLWERMRCYGRIPALRGQQTTHQMISDRGSTGGRGAGGVGGVGGGRIKNKYGKEQKSEKQFTQKEKRKEMKKRKFSQEYRINEAMALQAESEMDERQRKKKRRSQRLSGRKTSGGGGGGGGRRGGVGSGGEGGRRKKKSKRKTI